MTDGCETARRISENSEMRSTRGSHRCWTKILIDLIVDQPPLLEKGMNTHDRTNITRQIPTTGRDRQVFIRIQSIGIDHEVPIGHVTETEQNRSAVCSNESLPLHFRCFRAILGIEEFAQSPFLDGIDRIVVEPG